MISQTLDVWFVYLHLGSLLDKIGKYTIPDERLGMFVFAIRICDFADFVYSPKLGSCLVGVFVHLNGILQGDCFASTNKKNLQPKFNSKNPWTCGRYLAFKTAI